MRNTLQLFVFFLCCNTAFAQQYRLVTPKNNYVASDSTISFKWSVVDSATSYQLQVATDSVFVNVVYDTTLTTTKAQKVLSFGSTYYWKIRGSTLQGVQAWSYYRTFSVFKPSQLSGLVMWFDAAKNVTASGGAVSQWGDLSPSALHATQSNATNKPTLIASIPQLCNKPIVRFNGLGGASTSSNLAFATLNLTDYTALMVRDFNHINYMQYVVGGVGGGICAESNYYGGGFGTYQSTGALYSSLPSALVTGFGIYSTLRDHVFRNGVESPHCPTQPSNGFTSFNVTGVSLSTLGARTDAVTLALSYKGDVAEIVLYSNALDDATRNLAEAYLRYKYAPPVDLGADTIFNKFCVNANLSSAGCFSSYLWSTGATTASVNVTNFGTYWVRATDNLGYVSTDTIRVRPQIPFHQLPHNSFLCAGDSLVWNTGYPSSGFQFTWSNNATTPSITIKNPGTYFVKIKDAFNCTFYSDTIQVVVDPFPNHSLGPDTSFCAGNRLNFIYANPLNSILWSNSDTTNETVINAAGNYSVIAVNSNGCVNRDTIHVNIKGVAPNVLFTNPVLCATDTISFVDSTIAPNGNALVMWIWDFGNGQHDSTQNTTHVFPSNGTYTVSLTVYTDSGCVNTTSKNLSAYLKPQTTFQSKVACALAETQFLDFSSPPASIAVWKWHFSNLDSSILKNPKYAFPAQGKYEVVLKTTNTNGCSNTKTDSIEVFAPLSANFDFQNVCLGDSTAFTDVTSSLSIVSWLWNTGDSYFSTKKNLNHKYTTAGNYEVVLQIQNAIGCVDSIHKSINIYKSPTAIFGDLISCEDQYYAPLDSSVLHEVANTWKWNIDGVNYSGQAPQHFFADTGNYIVKLAIISQSGCKDSVSHLVYIAQKPKAAFTFTPLYGDAPLNVTFSNQSINAASYQWNFGDAVSDVVTNPSHTYTANDTFQIKLLATSQYGCKDSTIKSISVIHTDLDIAVDYVETDELPLSDGTVLVSVKAYLHNQGTRLITTTKLYATVGSGGVISEDWDTLMQTGAAAQYVFNAHFVVAAANANSYVCVEAKSVNNGETEVTLDNNRACASLNGVLQLIGPSPNPARENSYLGLILPKAGKVVIDIVDLLGRVVMQEEELDLPVGRTDYNLPVKMLRAGEYFVRVKYNNDKLLQKLVVH